MHFSAIHISGNKNNFINTASINRSVSKTSFHGRGSDTKAMRKDSVAISLYGKAVNLIDTLNKQKADIIERKNRFLKEAGEKGMSDDAIKSTLEQLNQQLKDIDKQLQEAMLKNMADTPKKSEEKAKSSKIKTKQDVQNKILANITEASSSLERTETIDVQRSKLDNSANILESEIKLDKAYDKTGSGAKFISQKESLLSELESRFSSLLEDIGEGLAQTGEILRENAELSKTDLPEDKKDSSSSNTDDDKEIEEHKIFDSKVYQRYALSREKDQHKPYSGHEN